MKLSRAAMPLFALSLATAPLPALAHGTLPAVTAQPGKPTLLLAGFDVGRLGYAMNEVFISGTAQSYTLPSPINADGRWQAKPAATAPYTTRMVVLTPDKAKFNGTVLVEWLNVTAGQDTPADFMVAHREMLRQGYAWVGVSAQQVGVEGGNAIMAQGVPLKKANPARYASLSHPGDAFSYDIFSAAGAALKGEAGVLLGGLKPRAVLAIGESQSAAFLTTYVNAIDPVARVYDGFFIHSRFGSGSGLDGTRMGGGASAMPANVHFRADMRVPLLTLITETDLLGGRLPGYAASRVADGPHIRVWELAGAAHADNYLFGGAFMDSGLEPVAALAHVFMPTTQTMAGKLDRPPNEGMPHHYVAEAALAALNSWVRQGKAPPHAPRLQLASGGGADDTPALARDAQGIARGGIRTPWTDVPTLALSGQPGPAGGPLITALVGIGEPFDTATLARLYPGGKAEYLARFTRALDRAIAQGFVLRRDRVEILAIAGMNYGAPG